MDLFIYLMLFTCLWSYLEEKVQCLSEMTQYANYVSWKNGLEFHTGCCVSLEKCLNMCNNNVLCEAVFHKEETSQCHLYKAKLQSTSDAFSSTGWRYYTSYCDEGWVEFGSKCYKAFTLSRTWNGAQEYCISLGGHLAVIDSEDIANFGKQHLSSSRRYWIGGKSEDGPDNFKWYPSMTNITYNNWAPGEPNNVGIVCIEIREAFLWNDYYCTGAKNFLCEKPLL